MKLWKVALWIATGGFIAWVVHHDPLIYAIGFVGLVVFVGSGWLAFWLAGRIEREFQVLAERRRENVFRREVLDSDEE